MNENDEPCLELNEMIYYVAGEFWKQAYKKLCNIQDVFWHESAVSPKESLNYVRKGLRKIAENKQLKFSTTSSAEFVYISINPFPIYVGIEKETGDFTVSAPHIKTRVFKSSEWECGLKWVQDYIDIDLEPLSQKVLQIRDKFYLNEKKSTIVKASIKNLCESILKKNYEYSIYQNRLRSEIKIRLDDKLSWKVVIYHKAFSENTAVFLRFLESPYELILEDKLLCWRVQNDK